MRCARARRAAASSAPLSSWAISALHCPLSRRAAIRRTLGIVAPLRQLRDLGVALADHVQRMGALLFQNAPRRAGDGAVGGRWGLDGIAAAGAYQLELGA